MKKLLFTLTALCFSTFAFSQWTTNVNDIYYNSGNVGIGYTNPSYKLDVAGNAHINNSLQVDHQLKVYGGTYGGLSLGQSYYSVQAPTNGVIIEGNVGIGTTSPGAKLHLSGTGTFNTDMTINGQDQILMNSTLPGNGGHFGAITWQTANRRRAAITATQEHSDIDFIGLAFFTQGTDGPGPFYESMRLTHSGNLGIGTTSPNYKLDVAGRIHSNDRIYGNRLSSIGGVIDLDAASGSNFWQLSNGVASLYVSAQLGLSQKGANVGIGTTSPTEKLEVNGTIRTKKVKVSATGWPDYVFANSYQLMAIGQLEEYIKKNKHLPEVPSAKEIETNGLDLGDMDATLLKKVEELTLYMIELNKAVKAQEERIKELENENQRLKKQKK